MYERVFACLWKYVNVLTKAFYSPRSRPVPNTYIRGRRARDSHLKVAEACIYSTSMFVGERERGGRGIKEKEAVQLSEPPRSNSSYAEKSVVWKRRKENPLRERAASERREEGNGLLPPSQLSARNLSFRSEARGVGKSGGKINVSVDRQVGHQIVRRA